jgi:hypothetical protein
MKEDSLGTLFARHLVMSISWALTLLIVVVVLGLGAKQQVKETLQYGARTLVYEAIRVGIDENVGTTFKDNLRYGIEFASKTAGNEVRSMLSDPAVRANLKRVWDKESMEKQ